MWILLSCPYPICAGEWPSTEMSAIQDYSTGAGRVLCDTNAIAKLPKGRCEHMVLQQAPSPRHLPTPSAGTAMYRCLIVGHVTIVHVIKTSPNNIFIVLLVGGLKPFIWCCMIFT